MRGGGEREQKDTLVLCSSVSDTDPYGSNLLKYRRVKKQQQTKQQLKGSFVFLF